MNVPKRVDIRANVRVAIVQKQDQRTGKQTTGIVKDILTSSPTHPHGIKVRLTSGQIGRVQKILSEGSGEDSNA
ncbi:MAG: YwbE family protein [Roseiflexaceae bacterium]